MVTWIRYYQIILAGLIGAVLAIVLVSLLMSAYELSQGTFKWNDLSNIGDFWNGHFGLFTLMVIAFGLYVQAQQFDAQLRTEHQERLILRREHAYTLLQFEDSRINQLKDAVRGYEMRPTGSGSLTWEELKGLLAVLEALRKLRNGAAGDYELWVEESTLEAYAQSLRKRASICERINGVNKELGDDALFENVPEDVLTGEQEVTQYLNDQNKKRETFLAQLSADNVEDGDVEAIKWMVQEGWRLSKNRVSRSWYVSARRFEVINREEVVINADAFSEVAAAYRHIADEWKRRFV